MYVRRGIVWARDFTLVEAPAQAQNGFLLTVPKNAYLVSKADRVLNGSFVDKTTVDTDKDVNIVP